MTLYYVYLAGQPKYTFFRPLSAWHFARQIGGIVIVQTF